MAALLTVANAAAAKVFSLCDGPGTLPAATPMALGPANLGRTSFRALSAMGWWGEARGEYTPGELYPPTHWLPYVQWQDAYFADRSTVLLVEGKPKYGE